MVAMRRILYVLAFLGAANFVISSMVFGSRGGMASIGHQDGQRFYLGNHGTYTEVTEREYRFNYYYELITIWFAFSTIVPSTIISLRTGDFRKDLAKNGPSE